MVGSFRRFEVYWYQFCLTMCKILFLEYLSQTGIERIQWEYGDYIVHRFNPPGQGWFDKTNTSTRQRRPYLDPCANARVLHICTHILADELFWQTSCSTELHRNCRQQPALFLYIVGCLSVIKQRRLEIPGSRNRGNEEEARSYSKTQRSATPMAEH